MPSYCVKALENTQSILCGLFLVCEHFCSGRTASHRTALDFRGIFVLLDAGGLSPAKEKRAKSSEKTYLPDVRALVNRRFQRFLITAPGQGKKISPLPGVRRTSIRAMVSSRKERLHRPVRPYEVPGMRLAMPHIRPLLPPSMVVPPLKSSYPIYSTLCAAVSRRKAAGQKN